jgi:hypothetical protein
MREIKHVQKILVGFMAAVLILSFVALRNTLGTGEWLGFFQDTMLPALGFAVVIIFAFLVLPRFMGKTKKPKKCELCGNESWSFYLDQNDKTQYFCNSHLFERWKAGVMEFPEHMMIIEPRFEKGYDGYLYATPELLKEWSYTKEDVERVNYELERINGGTCAHCGARAEVAYHKQSSFKWPDFAGIKGEALLMCKKCAINEIKPLIQGLHVTVSEGIRAPKGGRGVYHVQEF